MKVYFIGGIYMGCWYVRCYLPMIHNGWSGNYLGLEDKLKPTPLVNMEMQNADIIVFHRANTAEHHKIGMLLKQMGKKVVFDNDDTYKLDSAHPFWGLDEKGFEEKKKLINNVINNFVLNADLVTCSTEYLAKEYRKINKNVVVLPNYVDPDDWDEPERNDTDIVRIGLVGSVAYHHDFERIKDLLLKLDKDKRVQLVVFGLTKKTSDNPQVAKVYKREFAFIEKLKNLEHVTWCPMTEYFTMLNELRLDMMLIPRRENHFNKSKSNIKYLEASMCEIPVIAQSFPDAPYEGDITEDRGILVKTTKDWENAVESLITNKQKRRQLGKNAKEYVLKEYNIANHAHKWAEAYKKCL